MPVAERHQEYGREVAEALRAKGVRVHVDDRSEKMSYKIREAQVQKVPYMLVVGDKEVAAAERLRAPPPRRATSVQRTWSRWARRSRGSPRSGRSCEEVPPATAGGVQ